MQPCILSLFLIFCELAPYPKTRVIGIPSLSHENQILQRGRINSNLTSENDSSSTTTVGGDKQYFWGDRCGRYSTDLAFKSIVPIRHRYRHRHRHCSNGYTLAICCHGVCSWINSISGCAWHINQCGDDWTGVIRMPDAHGTTIQNEYTN